MRTCRVCVNHSRILRWDLISGRFAGCGSFERQSQSFSVSLFDEPCPKCDKYDLYATTAPALATVRTRYGPVPSRTAPGLFLRGCPDRGHAFLMFNHEGARAIKEPSGWFNPERIRKLAGE